jgi:hypothetical protein
MRGRGNRIWHVLYFSPLAFFALILGEGGVSDD